jgi:VWFA-related protein
MLQHKTKTRSRVKAAVLGLIATTMSYFAAGWQARAVSPPEISLYLNVEQGDKLIGGLAPSSFRLFEDGKARQFRIEPPENPASIVLLVEHSRSSSWYWNDIRSAVQGFIDHAAPGHWYALATFSREMELNVDFTEQKGEISEVLSRLSPPLRSEVNTYDAVHEVLDRMGSQSGRNVVILIGSGLDTFSSHTLDDVKRKIESTNVVVYGVGAGSQLQTRYEPYQSSTGRLTILQAEAFVQMLAKKSGGQAWFPRFEAAFPDVIKGIMQNLAFQYRLVYEPAAGSDGKFRKIKVEAFQIVDDERRDFKVRVREGWRL